MWSVCETYVERMWNVCGSYVGRIMDVYSRCSYAGLVKNFRGKTYRLDKITDYGIPTRPEGRYG